MEKTGNITVEIKETVGTSEKQESDKKKLSLRKRKEKGETHENKEGEEKIKRKS